MISTSSSCGAWAWIYVEYGIHVIVVVFINDKHCFYLLSGVIQAKCLFFKNRVIFVWCSEFPCSGNKLHFFYFFFCLPYSYLVELWFAFQEVHAPILSLWGVKVVVISVFLGCALASIVSFVGFFFFFFLITITIIFCEFTLYLFVPPLHLN